MFKQKDNNYNPNGNWYYENAQMQRIFQELEEMNRKLRNLNNRLRRVEGFLGLRNDDPYDKEIYYED